MARRPKRRRKRGGEAPRRKGGVMMGMRRGFKKAATSVVGAGESPKPVSRGRSFVSTAFTVLLVVAAIAFLFYRWQ